MVFFKQYLLTLTCIVIAVWVKPASAKVKVIKACDACEGILTTCGFEDNLSSNIQEINYTDNIEKELKGGTNKFSQNVAHFIQNTGVYGSITEAAASNGFTNKTQDNIKGMIRRITTNLSIKYKEFYKDNSKNKGLPITFFCAQHMKDEKIGFITKLFTNP